MEYDSKQVELERGVAGILCAPSLGKDTPAVLMLHGFASHKNEVGDLFKLLAESLATQGIISLRIDFRGWGDSAGDMADTTVDTLREDTRISLEYLAQLEETDASRLGLLGFSLGGATAVLTASELPDQIKSLVTWSSAGELEKDFRRSLGNAAFETTQSEGEVEIDMGWRSVRLKKGFFESLSNYAPITAIQNYFGAFFNVAGTEDFSAHYLDTYYENAAGEIKDRLLIEGADHIFNVLNDRAPFAEQALQATSEWFLKTL
ncbi:MAG: alpha/beta hydrolase [Chloroflexi bacterium]|nr:alpha/beta hydrolase [Chloroflexota bacterium]